MLAVLDPVLFSTDDPARTSELSEIVQILRKFRARIPDAPFYWSKLQRELIQPLSRSSSREIQVALDAIRSFVSRVRFPEAPPHVAVWDFRKMFGIPDPEWVGIMARLLTGCALTGEPTVVITRLIIGRNAEEHAGPNRCRLLEKTCWNLRVRTSARETSQIPLVCRRRNVSVRWTTRFDDRLPAEDDRALFPFCPPKDWVKSSTGVFDTHQGRPAWLDVKGNHWACPATGWGFHWDVYLEQGVSDRYGLSQLNIVRWGAPPTEGATGDLHHVPRDKKSRLKSTAGWTC